MAVTPKRSYYCRSEVIERIRIARGLTLERLAGKTGVAPKTIKRILGGHRAFTETIKSLALALGTSCESIIDDRLGVDSWLQKKPFRFALRLRLKGRLESRLQKDSLRSLQARVIAMLEDEGIRVTGQSLALTMQEIVEELSKVQPRAYRTVSGQLSRKRDSQERLEHFEGLRHAHQPAETPVQSTTPGPATPRYVIGVPTVSWAKPSWLLVMIDPDKLKEFVKSQHFCAYDFPYGEIVVSGWGRTIPRPVLTRVAKAIGTPITAIIDLTAPQKMR